MSFRRYAAIGAAAVLAVSSLAGCSSSDSAGGQEGASVELKIGASPTPHAKILRYIAEELAPKEGISLEVVEFQDYIKPNAALDSGDIDANYYQTVPYLEEQSKKQGFEFDHGEGIHLEPVGIYSENVDDVSQVKDGAKIGIINDPTNQSRALRLLADAGLLKLPAGEELNVSQVESSAEYNPKHLSFQQVEGPQLIRSLADVSVAVINGNYAQAGGKSPKDAIALESTENNPSLNILVWKKDTEKLEAIKKLDGLLHSPEVKSFIEKTWADKSVLPAF